MAEIEMEHEVEERPAFGRHRFGRFGRPNGGNGGGNGRGLTGGLKKLLSGLERRVSRFGVLEYAALAAIGIAVVDHAIAPKGQSYLSKIWDKISPGGGKHLLPPPPPPPPIPTPPPGALAAPKVGWWEMPWYPEMFEGHPGEHDHAGANLQAGWNRGMSPYGPWAVADPMAQYAHAAQRQRTGHHTDWYGWE